MKHTDGGEEREGGRATKRQQPPPQEEEIRASCFSRERSSDPKLKHTQFCYFGLCLDTRNLGLNDNSITLNQNLVIK